MQCVAGNANPGVTHLGNWYLYLSGYNRLPASLSCTHGCQANDYKNWWKCSHEQAQAMLYLLIWIFKLSTLSNIIAASSDLMEESAAIQQS